MDLRAIGYIRVSTEDQHLSPDAQRGAIEKWCADNGLTCIGCEVDIGISGSTPIDERPGLCAALAALAPMNAKALVLVHRDRLARDVVIAALTETLVAEAGARILTVQGTNGDTPEDQLLRTIVDAFAQYERARIRARTKMAMAAKKAKGQWLGLLPYGKTLPEGGGQPVDDQLEVAVIEMIGRLHKRGLSVREIGRELDKAGVPPRKGGRWQKTMVHLILQRLGVQSRKMVKTVGRKKA